MLEYGIALFALVISFFLDKATHGIFLLARNPFMNVLFLFFTELGSLIILPTMVISYILWKRNKKELLLPVWAGLIGSLAAAYAMKFIAQRSRPIGAFLEESGYSFPSAHAAVAFSLVPALMQEFPKLKWLWFMLAGMVAFSRVYLGVHYLSDIVAGSILGFMIGSACFSTQLKRIFRRIKIG